MAKEEGKAEVFKGFLERECCDQSEKFTISQRDRGRPKSDCSAWFSCMVN